MKNIAIYPGTFDPITFGHIDLVERATRLFDKIILGVAHNPEKKSLLTLEKRVEIASRIFKDNKKVKVMGFDCLLADFAKAQKANVILRGLRVISDFDYEFQMASMNRMLAPEIETVFLSPADRFTYVSSSLVREIARTKGDISQFVPVEVVQAIKKIYR